MAKSTADGNRAANQQQSGPKKESPATAGAGATRVQSGTPENRAGAINPSAPNDGVTPPAQP